MSAIKPEEYTAIVRLYQAASLMRSADLSEAEAGELSRHIIEAERIILSHVGRHILDEEHKFQERKGAT